MASVVQFSDFSSDSINFSDVHKNKLGGKAVYLNNKNGRKLLVQLPTTRAPFGLSAFEDKMTHKVTYTVPLSLDAPELQETFNALDEKIIEYAAQNSEELFGKKYTVEILKELYTPMVRPSKGDYAPQLKLKVQLGRNGEFLPKAYDNQRQSVPLDNLDKNTMIQTIVDINQIWVVDKKFGVTVRLEQVMMFPSDKLEECAFDSE
jgi:Family of unknown function (DUF5871)